MPAPTIKETITEQNDIGDFCDAFSSKSFRGVKKLQSLEGDDMGADGILEGMDGNDYPIEARRKGFPNHRGISCVFPNGWKSGVLDTGIMINESTLRKNLDILSKNLDKNIGLYYIVIIFNNRTKSEERKFARITLDNINEYLKQKRVMMKSTNSGIRQSVKYIPLKKFKTY